MIGAIASIAAPIVGGLIGAKGAKDAAGAQTAAAEMATAEQRRQFDLTRRDQAPWMNVGSGAVTTLGNLLGVNSFKPRSMDAILAKLRKSGKYNIESAPRTVSDMVRMENADGQEIWVPSAAPAGQGPTYDERALRAEAERLFAADRARAARIKADPNFGSLLRDFTAEDFEADPGYDFRLAEGEKAINRAAKARGMFMSPATVKELLRYGQDFASNEFGNAYNRDLTNRTTKFNFLSGASGGGQTAANTLANAGANYAGNIGQLVTGAGNARGAASIAGANALSGGINTIGNWYQQQQNRDQQQKMLDQMMAYRTNGGFAL